MQRLLPPHLFLLCATGAAGIGLAAPLIGPASLPVRVAGGALVVVGLAVTVRHAGVFARVGTNIKTFDDPDVLVTTGVFRFTRNPMYLGFLAALIGVAALIGSISALVGPAVFWLVTDRWYIPFEEQRMSVTFGQDYAKYRNAVPRWLGRRRDVQVLVP